MTLFRLGSLGVAALVVGCSTLPPAPPVSWPTFRATVVSDIHVLAPSLVTDEAGWAVVEADAFQDFRGGPAILADFVNQTLTDRPQVVIVAGDLTMEGEAASHRAVVAALRPLRDAGIPVLVIPGNHDVLNPRSSSFGPDRRPTPTLTPAEFESLYRDFGYGSALSRDPGSLSYLAEPVPGVRVLALDTARYEDNAAAGHQVTGGRIRPASWRWIEEVLDQARDQGVPVIAVVHHGLVEKFPGQGGLFADYLIADRDQVARRLTSRGVQLVLSGHFHSLSVAEASYGGRPLLEVESGALSQPPLGFRRLEFTSNALKVSTGYAAGAPGPGPEVGMAARIAKRLRLWGLPQTEAQALATRFAGAFAAVEAGDPVPPSDWEWPPRGLGLLGSAAVVALAPLPQGFWAPAAPADRDLLVPLPLPTPDE